MTPPPTSAVSTDFLPLAYSDDAYFFALRLLQDPADAEEAVQEAYLRVIRAGGKMPPPPATRPWFLRIVANIAKDRKIAERRRLAREDANAMRTTDETKAFSDELHAEVHRQLSELQPEYRMPLSLRYERGMGFGEIAKVLGISNISARVRASRGLSMLRERLAKNGHAIPSAGFVALLGKSMSIKAPAALGASVKGIVAGAPAGALPIVGVPVGASSIAAVVLLVAVPTAIIAATMSHSAISPSVVAGGRETKDETTPDKKGLTLPANLDPELVSVLTKKISVRYRHENLNGVALDLRIRTGIQLRFPWPIAWDADICIDRKEILVKDVLDQVATAVGATIDFRTQKHVVLWKPLDDKTFEALKTQARSEQPAERCRTFATMGTKGDVRLYPLLVAAMSDADPEVASWASKGLTQHRDTFGFWEGAEDSIPGLEALYNNPPPGVERWIPVALIGSTPGNNSNAALTRILNAGPGDWLLKSLVASDVMRGAGPIGQIHLAGMLMDGHPRVRSEAARAYQLFPEALPRKALDLLKDTDEDVRWTAAVTLAMAASHGKTITVDELLRLDTNADDQLRATLVYTWSTLLRTGHEAAFEKLKAALSHPQMEVRLHACTAAAYSGDLRFVPMLIDRARNDDNNVVQHNAALSGAGMGDDRCVQFLLDVLARNDEKLISGIATFLGQTQDERVIDPLLKMARGKDLRMVKNALRGLAQLRLPSARKALLDLLKDLDEEHRRIALDYLCAAGVPEAVDAQIEMVGKGDLKQRSSSADALGYFLYRDVPPDIKLRARAALQEYEKFKKEHPAQPAPRVEPPPAKQPDQGEF